MRIQALEDAIEDEAVANGDGGGEDYEEWGGFGDDESAQEEKLNGTKDEDEHVEPEQAPAKNKKQKQKKKAKDPKANGTQNLKTNGDTPSNPFVALADENNEEGKLPLENYLQILAPISQINIECSWCN